MIDGAWEERERRCVDDKDEEVKEREGGEEGYSWMSHETNMTKISQGVPA